MYVRVICETRECMRVTYTVRACRCIYMYVCVCVCICARARSRGCVYTRACLWVCISREIRSSAIPRVGRTADGPALGARRPDAPLRRLRDAYAVVGEEILPARASAPTRWRAPRPTATDATPRALCPSLPSSTPRRAARRPLSSIPPPSPRRAASAPLSLRAQPPSRLPVPSPRASRVPRRRHRRRRRCRADAEIHPCKRAAQVKTSALLSHTGRMSHTRASFPRAFFRKTNGRIRVTRCCFHERIQGLDYRQLA